MTASDELFLRRAMRLAMNGRGGVEPNPMVGCVLVKNGQVIGEGWHEKFGQPHAEPNALADCRARGNDPAGATAYVTLEPCCHTNKKTPPCAPRLIEAKVSRVVIGCVDPNYSVNGFGIKTLEAAGIAVELAPPPLDAEFRQLIAPFAAGHANGRELHLTLKWAQTATGRVAGRNGARLQISNPQTSRLVHQLRSRSGGIIVGINTVLKDDPLLTVRGLDVDRQPVRIVLDRQLRLPLDCKLVTSNQADEGGQLFVFCGHEAYSHSPRLSDLAAVDVQVEELEAMEGDDLAAQLDITMSSGEFGHNKQFLVEAGPTLARALLPTADRLWVIRSPMTDDTGPSAPRAANIPDHWITTGTLEVGGDALTEYLNTRSPAFFAPVESADLVLARESIALNASRPV